MHDFRWPQEDPMVHSLMTSDWTIEDHRVLSVAIGDHAWPWLVLFVWYCILIEKLKSIKFLFVYCLLPDNFNLYTLKNGQSPMLKAESSVSIKKKI